MRILIADDDATVSQLYSALLREQGHDVVPAYDAMQTLMFAMRSPQPDLILLDIGMPGGTGLEALRKLKASAKTALIPVLVVSGSTDAAIPGKVEGLGAAGFLQKPVQPSELLERIGQLSGISGR